ncbi:MAG: hypothetical protein IKH88_05395 [Prevotella sp.]|nr:hypothetical protein [Prevotella sp.]
MLVANPIYDIVFKYLMEDERIARDSQLQTSIKLLLRAGISPEDIAEQLGIDLQMVKDNL